MVGILLFWQQNLSTTSPSDVGASGRPPGDPENPRISVNLGALPQLFDGPLAVTALRMLTSAMPAAGRISQRMPRGPSVAGCRLGEVFGLIEKELGCTFA